MDLDRVGMVSDVDRRLYFTFSQRDNTETVLDYSHVEMIKRFNSE